MVTVGMNYRVVPGREAEFERVFRGVVMTLSGEPEHVSTRLFRSCESLPDYLILSEWRDREAFEGFIGSEAFRRITSWSLDGVLRGRPSHEIYESSRQSVSEPSPEAADAGRCPVHQAR